MFQAQFDATLITMLANSFEDAVLVLKEKDKSFYTEKDGTLKYKWRENYSDTVDLNEYELQRGIISWESH